MNTNNSGDPRTLVQIEQEYAQNAFELGDAFIKKSFIDSKFEETLKRGKSLLQEAEILRMNEQKTALEQQNPPQNG